MDKLHQIGRHFFLRCVRKSGPFELAVLIARETPPESHEVQLFRQLNPSHVDITGGGGEGLGVGIKGSYGIMLREREREGGGRGGGRRGREGERDAVSGKDAVCYIYSKKVIQ